MSEVIKTILLVAFTTSKMYFPGISMVPSENAANKAKLDGTRNVLIMLKSETAPNADSFAEIELPKDLGLGDKVGLYIDRRYLDKETNVNNKHNNEISSYIYWGSNDNIPEGQPLNYSNIPTKENILSKLEDSENFKTLAYYPAIGGRSINPQPKIEGDYKLITNFVGSTTFKIDSSIKYLDVLEITDLSENTDINKPITIKWKPISGARAYIVKANGGSMTHNVQWTSSNDPYAIKIDFKNTPIDNELLTELIKKGILLSPETTYCTIPASVFNNCSSAVVSIEAIGNDTTQIKDGIKTSVVTRSNAGVLLFQVIEGPPLDPNKKGN